ncbi:MAG: DUF4129 domain-containing protein [Phycisphaerae bacterium]|nr:DUF4129 domain-containing protein [Gemmatimonadaceae bacterium]
MQDSLRTQTWGDQAIRDTIAAIAQAPEYSRDVGQSLMSRGLRWLWQQILNFFHFVSETQYGREITIALVVIAIALVIARVIIGVRADQLARRPINMRGAGAGGAIQITDAEQLAASGNYTAAAHALFSSLLAAGAARGEFRVHPSKTTGDYVADLRRRRTDWLRPFQSFRSRYDRVIYGDMQCSAEDYQALMSDVRQMMARG